ncbi:MAG: hypothetical protein II879_08730, partial [Clostridia bacterium]|nr:hypothetical protein [Clostridia bacterium]
IQGLLAPDILMKRTAEVVRDIILPVRKGSGAAKTVHDRTGRTMDAGFDRLAVNRAMTLVELFSRFKHTDSKLRAQFSQFKSGIDTARSSSDDNNVVVHKQFPALF